MKCIKVYSQAPITAFATVVTAVTVAAIKRQGGCLFSKLAPVNTFQNLHKSSQVVGFGGPGDTRVNNYGVAEGAHRQFESRHSQSKHLFHEHFPFDTQYDPADFCIKLPNDSFWDWPQFSTEHLNN